MSELGIGVLGAGRICGAHARTARALPSTRLAAICDIDEERVQEAVGRFGGTPYTDYQDLLQDPAVDAVSVCLPHWLHADTTVAAAEAGKHILVEKPMAMTVPECDRMIAAADANGVTLAIAHTHHFFPVNLEVKRIVAAGEIGDVVLATDTWYKPFWQGGKRPPWFLDDAKGGGMWPMNGSHMIDRLSFVLGARAKSVKARLGNPTFGLSTDMGIAFLQFDNGVGATIQHAGFKEGVSRFEGEIIGTAGHLRFTGRKIWRAEAGEWAPAEIPLPTVPVREGEELPSVTFGLQISDFAAAISEGRPPEVAADYGRYVVQVLTGCEESSRTGREVLLT